VLGTAAYISPEQAAGEPAGPASDVYSFGVILFRMLTGALPFTADNAVALVNMHRQEPAPAVETLQPDAPPELAALTATALRKDPAQRPSDGEALLAALGAEPTAVVARADTEATRILPAPAPAPAEGPPSSDGRRRGALIAAAIVLLAAAGGVLAWAVTRSGSTPVPSTSSVTGTHTHRHGTTATTQTPSTSTTAPTTTAHTTTAATTQRASTTIPTTAPTTTALPPTTTATVPTTVPTTTSGLGTTTVTP
jgi:serine/threonine-protein kinase